MPDPTGIRCVIPSCVAVGETFSLRVKVLGPVRRIDGHAGFKTKKPALHGPFNLNVCRNIQFMDNVLPEWCGGLEVAGGGLEGNGRLLFDGRDQGAFEGDARPIKVFGGFRWTQPGFHFVRLVDAATGIMGWSNPVFVSETPPSIRIYWGDPHWQTFFSDGVRCPEELYAFARNEGFLDFGALADHMEAVTDRQWEYFQAVTNDYNEPGRFATLHGQEWTNHNPEVGAPGHRNVYYRGDGGPVLRSDAPDCNTPAKLWSKLDAMDDVEALAIPHHSANKIMGVDWEQGWNPKYEKAVEIYSVWGSSEKGAEAGNTRPIRSCGGEVPGRHVVDALRRGYRFGFVGGGDIHDGRPGDAMHDESYPREGRDYTMQEQGFSAVWLPALTREAVFDAMRDRRTYGTTMSRIYLDPEFKARGEGLGITLRAASEEGVREVALVRNGEDIRSLTPAEDPRIIECDCSTESLGPKDFLYLRLTTGAGNMAWSSPVWGDELQR